MTTRDGRRLYAMVRSGPAGDGTVSAEAAPTEAAATVVFEAGAAAARSSWGLVQPQVAAFARAVAYDRSGLGRSAPDPAGRTLDRMADDLGDVLDHFAPGPFVLVGHSAGGPLVRLAASRRPDLVAGLVLVDPADEAADVLFGRAFRRGERLSILINGLLARVGALKPLFRFMLAAVPEDVRRDLEREAFTPGVIRTQAAQARTFLDELAGWREAPPRLGDIPVTVVSGALPGSGMNTALRAAANAAHAQRAAASPHGRHVTAARSGHYVPITDPGVVTEEIRRLVRDR